MPTPAAVYDANVLYPAHLRDLLMWLGVCGVVRPHWSPEIQREWMRNLRENRDDISREDVEYTRSQMETALPDASVEGYDPLISNLHLPDEDDRHVLAAAIHISAEWLVTFNLKDFPAHVLRPHGVKAISPDDFIIMLHESRPLQVIEAVRKQRKTLRNPPMTASDLLAVFSRSGLSKTAEMLSEVSEQI